MQKIRTFFERIIMFFEIGYFNPKYVLLANIANSTNSNNSEVNSMLLNEMLWNEASHFYAKGDKIYDALYRAIYDLKILQTINLESGDSKNE